MEPWSNAAFHLQHWQAMYLGALTALYVGDANDARGRLERDWPRFEASLLSRFGQLRVPILYLRARLQLETGARDALDQARRTARQLEHEQIAWAHPLAMLLDACVAARSGKNPDAVALMIRAAELLDEAEMPTLAAFTRRRLGAQLGDAEGAQLVSRADAFLGERTIASPSRAASMFVTNPWCR
jgi:hypothetical protein